VTAAPQYAERANFESGRSLVIATKAANQTAIPSYRNWSAFRSSCAADEFAVIDAELARGRACAAGPAPTNALMGFLLACGSRGLPKSGNVVRNPGTYWS